MPAVLLGVTGCIAAYKACEIIRGLQKALPAVDIKVVMSKHATEFVGPSTFRALTRNEVAIELFDKASDPVHHISLARWADVFCIAPATANVCAKLSYGQADDLLTTTALASTAPLIIAPAMNTAMYNNKQTQHNMAELSGRATIIPPEDGYLACADTGTGRLAVPDKIIACILDALKQRKSLKGKHVLVSAGPTHEPLDPVRYLSNRSSGRMGYALAHAAIAAGAELTLVSGPVALKAPFGAHLIQVQTADEMLEALQEPFESSDIALLAAAVSDWRPAEYSDTKLVHTQLPASLALKPNPDIAATLCANKGGHYVAIFAAQTQDPREAARKKLKAKGADLVIANNVSEPNAGFEGTHNHVWLITDTVCHELALAPKYSIARQILDFIVQDLHI